MSTERFRVLVACIAVLALVAGVLLSRYTMFIAPTEKSSGYLLDRWTGNLTFVYQNRRHPVATDEAK